MKAKKNSFELVGIALGSNLEPKATFLQKALLRLHELPHKDFKVSPCYESLSFYDPSQPSYLNCVAVFETHLEADQLLRALQKIENDQGRKRNPKQSRGPRTLDLDLIFYGDARTSEPGLTIPHPRVMEREFVLRPLCDLIPEGNHPLTQTTWISYLKSLKPQGLSKINIPL